jgi:mannose-6-phosphate isomerase-like protein (cupin superfamily)
MLSSAPQEPINMTATVEKMTRSGLQDAFRARACSDGQALEIRFLQRADDGHPNAGLVDHVYVIISGYGQLSCGETILEFTAGDVLLVPKGHPHRFQRLDGDISIWQMLFGPAAVVAVTME